VADDVRSLDSDWLRDNPLPVPDDDTDKNGRGRVLAIGGSRIVPGGIRLTVEAALRAGAGKVQVVTIETAAIALGVAMPEAAVFGVEETHAGEIAQSGLCVISELMTRCDAIVAGPAMGDAEAAGRIVDALLAVPDARLVLDAQALLALERRREAISKHRPPAILTPHIGEMAAMLQRTAESIEHDRCSAAREAAERFAAVCVLKGPTTIIADPEGAAFAYAGGGVGLATGGSGDVMAGVAAGLSARGAAPLNAALWAVWLHGEAGRRCSERFGAVGYLAREVIAKVPGIMRGL